MIRVLLVDDQPLVRAGLRRILSGREGFEVVGECEDGAGVPATVDETSPDLVVMDIRMKGVDGVEATRRLRERADAPPVLVLTTFDDDEVLSAAVGIGGAVASAEPGASRPTVRRMSARLCRPSRSASSSACSASAGSLFNASRAPVRWSMVTVSEWAIVSWISRAIRWRSPAAA